MQERPNILFVLSDQHRADLLGCAGDEAIRTPNLDALAGEGAIFNQAYCQNPLCVPSRASLITGQYCRTIGIYQNIDIMEPNSLTFPRLFSQHGYRTCLVGKAHFNGEQFHGYQQRPYGDLYGQAHQPDPRRTPENGASGLGSLVGNAGPTEIPLPMTQTEICVSEATKWLQTHVDLHPQQPFCLSVHFDKPHFPVRPPQKYFAQYDGRVHVQEVPEGYYENAVPFVQKAIDRFGYADAGGDRYLASYYGCITWVDDAVGRLLAVLDYLGLRETTLVVYTSDHGDLCGEKGAWNKTLFFDAAAKVPLILRWPGTIPAGGRIADLVGLIDLYPTLCEGAGIPVPSSCEGLSLLPRLQGAGSLPRQEVFSESAFLGEPSAAGCMIRRGKWKYTTYLDGSEELYNLEEDPGEWTNLASDPEVSEIQASLRKDVIAFWGPEEQLRRLRSTPKVSREKHFYEFSNQFVLGNGTVANARP